MKKQKTLPPAPAITTTDEEPEEEYEDNRVYNMTINFYGTIENLTIRQYGQPPHRTIPPTP